MEEVTGSQIFGDEQPNIVEITLKEFDENVELKKALDRLLDTPEYKLVLGKVYITDEAKRLGDWIKNPVGNHTARSNRDVIVESLASIGNFEKFINDLKARLHGIDDPAQRVQLVEELNSLEEV